MRSGYREQVQGDSRIICHEAGCTIVKLEKGTPAANRAERAIKMLKDDTKKDLFDSNCPMTLWCYCVERRATIIYSTVRTNHLLQGTTPYSYIAGQSTDISSISEYGWYEWVIYRMEDSKFPVNHQRLEKILGPAKNAGSAMSQWVLSATGDIMPIQTLRSLTEVEYARPSMKTRMKEFEKAIVRKPGDLYKGPLRRETPSSQYPRSQTTRLIEQVMSRILYMTPMKDYTMKAPRE